MEIFQTNEFLLKNAIFFDDWRTRVICDTFQVLQHYVFITKYHCYFFIPSILTTIIVRCNVPFTNTQSLHSRTVKEELE